VKAWVGTLGDFAQIVERLASERNRRLTYRVPEVCSKMVDGKAYALLYGYQLKPYCGMEIEFTATLSQQVFKVSPFGWPA
jgi:hypothetical protein